MVNYETKRCIVRPFELDDIEDVMVYRNNLEWMEFQGYKGKTKEEYAEGLLRLINLSEGCQLAIFEKDLNKVIGDVYLIINNQTLKFGYTINPEYARRGYTFEVMDMIIEEMKDVITTFKAGVDKKNIASIKLLEKLGLKYSHLEDEDLIYIMNN